MRDHRGAVTVRLPDFQDKTYIKGSAIAEKGVSKIYMTLVDTDCTHFRKYKNSTMKSDDIHLYIGLILLHGTAHTLYSG